MGVKEKIMKRMGEMQLSKVFLFQTHKMPRTGFNTISLGKGSDGGAGIRAESY